jgi:protein TonB
MSPRFSPDLPGRLARQALPRMLLLSLGVHLVVIFGVQARPGSSTPYTHVISARIVENRPAVPAMPAPDQAIPEDLPRDFAAPPKHADPVPGLPDSGKQAPSEAPKAIAELALAASATKPAVEPSSAPVRDTPKLLPSVPVMVDTTWYSARQLDTQPKARFTIEPAYPEEARQAGIVGTVTLLVRVDEFGMVKEAKVESATPPGVFDESALQAFKAGQFIPARIAGKPVRAEIRIRVTYSLSD